MSEKKIEGIVRDFREAFVKRDVEKMLSFFAEDAVWVSPVSTFKGKEELKHVLTWDTQIMPTVKARPSGIGTMVKGNKAVTESVSEGTYEGKKYEVLSITVFEFSDDKIQHIRLFYDKLSMIKQVVMQYKGVSGWFAKRLVNSIKNARKKGYTSLYYMITKSYKHFRALKSSFELFPQIFPRNGRKYCLNPDILNRYLNPPRATKL